MDKDFDQFGDQCDEFNRSFEFMAYSCFPFNIKKQNKKTQTLKTEKSQYGVTGFKRQKDPQEQDTEFR